MTKLKYAFWGFIIGIITTISISTFAAVELNVIPNPYPVLINSVKSTVAAYNINGFTYLKLADLKQTGLKISFNETDKQIEITSVAVPTVSQTPDTQSQADADVIKNMTPVEPPVTSDNNTTLDGTPSQTKIAKTPDGLDVTYYYGKNYVSIGGIYLKYKNLNFQIIEGTKQYTLIRNNITLIDIVPNKVINVGSAVDYDYYVNTMLPLLN